MNCKFSQFSIFFALIMCATSTNIHAEDGKAVYEKNCKACHDSGEGGAPKFGSLEDWQDRIETGIANLEASAINGMQGYGGVMPPRGGNPQLSDSDVKAAVGYILRSVKQ